MSEAERDAALLELETAADSATTPRIGAEVPAGTGDKPEASDRSDTERVARCLGTPQRIGDSFDPRASARDRIRAAELREQYIAATSERDPIRDEVHSWSEEERDSFLAEDG